MGEEVKGRESLTGNPSEVILLYETFNVQEKR